MSIPTKNYGPEFLADLQAEADASQAPEGGDRIAAMRQALEALEVIAAQDRSEGFESGRKTVEAITALRAALAAQPQAAPAITEAEIDRVAALTEKAMEEGLRGFCRTWGWQQFARTLVENLRPYGLRITPKEPTNDR